MRGTLLLPALAVLLAAAVSGCRKREAAGGPVVLRYLAAPEPGGALQEISRRFEASHPGIKIRIIEGPAATDTREDMYAASFMAGEDTYDLAYMDVAWVPKFASQGWLRPLDDRFPPSLRRKFLPGDMAGSIYQGRIYRVPVRSDGGLLYYRKDLLAAAGLRPPRTWEELVSEAKRLQRPPARWGLVFEGKQYEGLVCCWLELLWGGGGDVIDAGGRVRAGEPQAVRALRRLVDAVHVDKISPEGVLTFQEEEARRSFQEGHAVFMRNWPYAWSLLQAPDSPVRGKVGLAPMVHEPGQESAAVLGGWGLGVSAFSKHPKEAWEFARFNARPDIQELAFRLSGFIPARREPYSDAKFLASAPQMREIGRVLARARPRPMLFNYARVSDALQLHLSAALSLQETPEQAMAEAADEIRVAVSP